MSFAGILRALITASPAPSSEGTVQMLQPSAVQRGCLAASALPLMGRFADDDGPLDRAPEPKPEGNRRQRRAKRHQRT